MECVLNLPLDEGRGDEARDISGYANGGELKHGSSWAQLASGLWVYAPDGTDDYIDVPFASQLNQPAEAITMECWIYLDRLSSVYGDEQTIVSKRHNGTTGYGMNIHNDTDSLRCALKGLDDDFPSGAAPAMVIETWYHCVVTYDGEYLRTYVNGVQELEDASSGVIDNNSEYLTLAKHDETKFLDGRLSRFRVYDYALLPSAILDHYQSEKADYLAYSGVTLASLTALIRIDLNDLDSGNYRWTDSQIERAIAKTLSHFNYAIPQELDTLIATAKNSRLVPLYSLVSRVSIDKVEYPIDQTPKSFTPFEVRGNQVILKDEADGKNCRVYWTKRHTISATECTLPEEHHELLCLGATAYLVISQSQYQSDRANIGGEQVDRDYAFWGRDRMKQFNDEIKKLSRKNKVRVNTMYTE